LRILLISDVHSNLEALEACLAAAPAHDRVVNLGDVVGYGASPNEVTDRARAQGAILVRGNHDKACTGAGGLEFFNPIAAWAAMWTQEVLTEENREWLRALPAGPVPLEGVMSPAVGNGENGSRPAPVYCVHGSPLDEDEYLLSGRDAVDVLARTGVRLTFFGHTHVQGGFALSDGERAQTLKPAYETHDDAEHAEFSMEPATKYLINPGSVGQPRDGDWRAGFALFDSDAYALTYYRVPYEIEKAQQRIYEAKLPDRLALRLREGR
jgi:predicted phosphodiesterase